MTVHEMLLNYAQETADLLTPLAIMIAIERARLTWTDDDTKRYGTEIARRLRELDRELRSKA